MLGVAPHLSPIMGSGWDFRLAVGRANLSGQGAHAPAALSCAWDCSWEGAAFNKVMALVWVLRDLGSSAGPVSLTCEIWICFSQPSTALSSSTVVKIHKNGLDGVWCSLAFGKRCEAGLLGKGASENSKHFSDPHSWSSWVWKGPLAVTCPTPHIQEG